MTAGGAAASLGSARHAPSVRRGTASPSPPSSPHSYPPPTPLPPPPPPPSSSPPPYPPPLLITLALTARRDRLDCREARRFRRSSLLRTGAAPADARAALPSSGDDTATLTPAARPRLEGMAMPGSGSASPYAVAPTTDAPADSMAGATVGVPPLEVVLLAGANRPDVDPACSGDTPGNAGDDAAAAVPACRSREASASCSPASAPGAMSYKSTVRPPRAVLAPSGAAGAGVGAAVGAAAAGPTRERKRSVPTRPSV